jgi:hypothetical protein
VFRLRLDQADIHGASGSSPVPALLEAHPFRRTAKLCA